MTLKPISVVVGGAGFIGSHLCDKLLRMGHFVVCIDNFTTGSYANIMHASNDENFEVIECDINKPLVFSGDIDYLYNLASPASPDSYQNRPLETLMCGSIGVLNLLNLANAKSAKFLQASTSEVYGDPSVNPQPETYYGNVNSVGPRSMYDESKRFAEALVTSYNTVYTGFNVIGTRSNEFNTHIARIFNTYGPRMQIDDGRVVPNFVTQSLCGKPVTVYGDGAQTRSLCYVDDTVNGLIWLMMSDCDTPVNIGNPNEMSIMELAETIIALTNSASAIQYNKLPMDDPKVRCPDISKAISTLPWKPTVNLIDGLLKTISYFKTTERM